MLGPKTHVDRKEPRFDFTLSIAKNATKLSRATGYVVTLISALLLTELFLKRLQIFHLNDFLIEMNLLGVFCLFLLGSSIVLIQSPKRRKLGYVTSLGLILLGGITMGRILTVYAHVPELYGPPLAKSALFFRDPVPASSAVAFILLGGAILLSHRKERVSNQLWTASLILAFLVITVPGAGFLFDLAEKHSISSYGDFCVLVTGLLLFSFFAVFVVNPERRAIKVLQSNQTGGFIFRGIIPAALLTPLILGWLRIAGERRGYYPTDFGIALMSVTLALLVALVTYNICKVAIKSETGKELAEEEAQRLSSTLNAIGRKTDIDKEGKIVRASQIFSQFLGLASQEIIGHKWVDLIFGPDIEKAKLAYERMLTVGLGEVEVRTVRKNGVMGYDRLQLFKVSGSGNDFEGFYCFWTDITERVIAQEKIRAYAQEVSELFNGAPCGYHSLDPNGIILRVNETELKWLGYTEDEMVGKSMRSFLSAKGKEMFDARFYQARDKGEVKDLETYIRRKDGSEMPVLINAIWKKDQNGKILASRSNLIDLTDRKRMEQASAAKEELELFTRIASHDLQEPIRGVLLITQLLQKQHAEQLDEKGLEYLKVIEKNAQRMSSLIRDVSSYGVASRTVPKHVRTPSLEIVDDVLSALSASIKEAGPTIQKGPLPVVNGDPNQLGVVFQNLISNAIKYRHSDRRLEIEISSKMEGNFWLFWVKDNGRGFDSQYAETVFVPFKRLQRFDEVPGSGIGLAICKKIIHKHGGRMWVKSKADEGSTFYFTLPVVEGDSITVTNKGSQKLNLVTPKPIEILHVEDNASDSLLVKNYLHRNGFNGTIRWIRDGQEAKNYLFAENPAKYPDLILMDLSMPVIDGYRLLRLLKDSPKTAHIPVIVVTSSRSDFDRERCLQSGASAVYSKPTELDEFDFMINSILQTELPKLVYKEKASNL